MDTVNYTKLAIQSLPTESKIAKILSSAICLLVLCFSSSSYAAEQNKLFGKKATGKWIIGAKVGKIDSNSENINDATANGIVVGYEFDKAVGTTGGSSTVELEYLKSDETSISGFGDYDAEVLGLYFTYRSAGDLYFKFKGGLNYSELTYTTPAFDQTFNEVSLSAGIGVGYHVGDFGVIELEYTEDTGSNDIGVYGLNALLEF